jgi:hypothetical protein
MRMMTLSWRSPLKLEAGVTIKLVTGFALFDLSFDSDMP